MVAPRDLLTNKLASEMTHARSTRIFKLGKPIDLSAIPLTVGLVLLTGLSMNCSRAEDLPDLVVSDIYLAPTPERFASQDVIFVGVTVGNDGVSVQKKVSIDCSFDCRGESRRYFGDTDLLNGIGSREQANLFDKTPLDISGCYLSSVREFTCTVDENDEIEELDETNNVLKRILKTGK